MWQGYFVEGVILGVGLCIVALRGLEYALLTHGGEHAGNASPLHFPLSFPLGEAFSGLSTGTIENAIYLVAMLKIVISFAWMITISLTPTMGVAWHRFLAFFNIWFKRESSGRTALGRGQAAHLRRQGGHARRHRRPRRGLRARRRARSRTSAGRASSTSPPAPSAAAASRSAPRGTPRSRSPPSSSITALRDHAHAKAPYLQAGSDEERAALLEGNDTLTREVERPLVGDTGDDWFYMPENGAAVIDPEVLWNCTSCGACVQQCPVDIEHVDHIIDMRRYAVLVESNFPAELNGLFKGLENKGNPWNMSPNARLDWAKGLDFEVKVVGDSIESLDEVDWLFWVGCAGAYEDRAKKTTRAVAELLDMAGVSFGVLGNGETCTGDPARRAGNEFVFQGLAQQNVETFKEYKVKKVVSTCAHCFNTLKNEYKEFGVELEVVHHTQLLNRLVREGRLTPVTEGAGAAKRSITYHDPCYIGRHNGVYTPPRELLQILPGAEVREMPRNSERSFCCGAGGARMWMEENTGERINVNRTKEAVETGADQIAVGCPFCRVMLSDGLTAQQAKGEAREEVEVLDVAQMLLASVKGEVATKAQGRAAKAGSAAALPPALRTAARGEGRGHAGRARGRRRHPDRGDRHRHRGRRSAGQGLRRDVAVRHPGRRPASPRRRLAPRPDAGLRRPSRRRPPPASGGSLFDLGGDEPAAKAEPAKPEPPKAPARRPRRRSRTSVPAGRCSTWGHEPAASDRPRPRAGRRPPRPRPRSRRRKPRPT